VNVLRIRSDGIVEIRIHSHKDRAANYSKGVADVMGLVAPLLGPDDLKPYNLDDLKNKLWDPETRKLLREDFAFLNSRFHNSMGTRVDASVGTLERDLLEDEDLVAGIDRFRQDPTDAHCSRLNLVARDVEALDGTKRHVNVILTDETNEFVLTERLDGTEYNALLHKILHPVAFVPF
jgi:hypothetical protein